MPFSFFVKLLFTYFGIYRIDPHATFVALVEDENSISIRHCEERLMRRGNLIPYFFE